MARSRRRASARKRIGNVSVYARHGAWYVYYLEGFRQVRRRVASARGEAEAIAAQINAQLSVSAPSLFAFEPITVLELRRRFLDYHEHVLHSSLATVKRYRAATRHFEEFVQLHARDRRAHEVRPEAFAAFLRGTLVSPNGHPRTRRRRLRDKGVRFILECCRSLYNYAHRMRHLPPYAANPFTELRLDRFRVEDAKPVFVFDEQSEEAFFRAADDAEFPIHFMLAKTGVRPGELVHLLVEDLDLERGWLQVRGKPHLGWQVKTRHGRIVPLVDELVQVLRLVVGSRTSGLVFLRPPMQVSNSVGPVPTSAQMERLHAREIERREAELNRPLTRQELADVASNVWREAGLIRVDKIRISFEHVMQRIGHPEATCPKSWRHTFATLLQDAGVDPLVRQITLGHKPTSAGSGALGMTTVYTHTRPETLRAEILRAMRLWPVSLQLAQQWAEGNRSCP